MPTNFYMFFITALIPLFVGFIYYHPKVFGNHWMKINGFTQEQVEQGNMLITFGVTYVLGIMLSLAFSNLVIHQAHVYSLLMPQVTDATSAEFADMTAMMEKYGDRFRTFKHGALHGFGSALFIALPILGINALFEHRGFKYIALHAGYWIITMTLIGGVICQTLKYA
jgi:hypothetical protein